MSTVRGQDEAFPKLRIRTRREFIVLGLLLGLTLLGAIGFRLLSDEMSWVECLYVAVVTLTTLGSREPSPHTPPIMMFTIAYVVVGMAVFTYSVTVIGESLLNAQLRSFLGRRRMNTRIGQLAGHYIVCGFGRMGSTICAYLHSRREPFVVVDNDAARLSADCESRGWMYLAGDATDDSVLQQAGITRAKSLASVLPTDADNVYVTLTARMLAPALQIIARASDEKAVLKMQRAGATRVVSPFSSGAQKMARFMLNPSIEDFLEIADSHGNDLELADVQLTEHSPYIGQLLRDTDLRDKGVMVIGIRRASGERLMPPPPSAEAASAVRPKRGGCRLRRRRCCRPATRCSPSAVPWPSMR